MIQMLRSFSSTTPLTARGVTFALSILLSPLLSAQTGLPWSSGFETSDLSEWNGYDTGTVQVTSEFVSTESHSVYVELSANSLNNNYLEHYFGDHSQIGLEPVEEVYLKFDSRFDSGYRWPSRQGHKIALLNITDESGQRRYQVYLYVDSGGRYVVDSSHIDSWTFYGLSQNVGTPATVRFDQWDTLKLYVRLNDPSQSNGIVRLWVNGALKMEYADRNLRGSTSFAMNKLILSSYTTNESGGSGIQRYDNWTLSETDPDTGENSVPSPPTNVQIIR